MFNIHATDLRRTPEDAVRFVENFTRHIVSVATPIEPGSLWWALQLYDFARVCFEVRENLAGQPLTEAQGRRALAALDELTPYFLLNFRALAPYDRLEDGCRALVVLAGSRVEGENSWECIRFDMLPLPLAHVDAQWLQNTAHNEYLTSRRVELYNHMRANLRMCPGQLSVYTAPEPLRPVASTRMQR